MKNKVLDDFTNVYVMLSKNGEVETFEGGYSFLSLSAEKLDKIGTNWLITEFGFEED